MIHILDINKKAKIICNELAVRQVEIKTREV